MLDHISAAEQALRERARATRGEERATAQAHADLLAQVQQEFKERPFSEGAIQKRELVDALLDGTDALRLKADVQRRARREAEAVELERKADAILELDREL